MIGRTVSHYKLIEKIGEGGMGVVYRAEDTRLSRPVALKFLHPHLTTDPDARRRFVNEARAASALNHSNIAVIHDIGESPDGQMFIVMACYDGATLKDMLAQGARPVADAVRITRELASGLARAHESGIIHRDLKPANVLVTKDGEVRLTDFGLAKLASESRITQTGTTVGTIHYMSPEQARGDEVDQRSDIFSLGVVLYELLAGRTPFRGDHAAAVIYSIMNAEAPPLSSLVAVPPELERIVDRALAKSPRERYQSAADMLSDLDAFQSGDSVARGTPRRAVRRLPAAARRVAWAAAVLVVVAAGVIGVIRRAPRSPAPGTAQSIAVLPFRNLSGDNSLAWMEEAIPEMLSAALSRSSDLSVLDRIRVVETLKAMGHDPALRVDEAATTELARRASIGTIIVGDILKSQSTIRVQSKVVEASTGRILHSDVVEGSTDDDLFRIVAELTDQVQTYLHIQAVGEVVDETWIRDITTRSLDAYRHYVRGRSLLMQSAFAESRHEFEAAIAADSNFVMAYVDLTGACFNLDDYPCIASAYEHARRLRERASPREQLYIDLIGAIIHDESEQQIRIASELLRGDPTAFFWRYVRGRGYYMSGRYDEAVAAWQSVYEERWPWVWTYIYMSDALRRLGRLDEALAVVQTGFEIVPASRADIRARLHRYRGRVHRDRGDYQPSLADFDEAERLLPGYAFVKYDRGILRQAQGERDAAARLFREFIAEGDDGEEMGDARARLHALEAATP